MQHKELILGGPGCGKTTKLLDLVEQHLKAGIQPNEIAYVAFTRKAASEAKSRARALFGFSEKDLPYFRTLHSFAFKELGIGMDQLMNESHYTELGDILKVGFGKVEDEFGIISEQRERGSQYYHIEQQARLRRISVKQMAQLDGRQGYWLVQHYQDTLNAYKREKDVLDYTDILELWLKKMWTLPVKVLIVDEAQDLCPLQWEIIHKLEQDIPFVYYAGDDDQAIYEWAGADVNHFLQLEAQRTVLPVSYRLPKAVFNKCVKIASRIRTRYAKEWRPTDKEGKVSVAGTYEMAPVQSGEWMILARNHYHLEGVGAWLRARGYAYTFSGKSSLATGDALAARAWLRSQPCDLIAVGDAKRILSKFTTSGKKEMIFKMPDNVTVPRHVLLDSYGVDLEQPWDKALSLKHEERTYLRMVVKQEGSLDVEPRIKASTIHAVKGGEAQNVLLLSDMSSACYESFIKKPDTECRSFYVGASRAKENLIICQPREKNYFPL